MLAALKYIQAATCDSLLYLPNQGITEFRLCVVPF